MTIFDYKCETCGNEIEVVHSIHDTSEVKCRECSTIMIKLIKSSQFFIKGTTTSKLWQEERWKHKKNAELEVKQIERYGGGPKLRPNIGGTDFDNWSDAKKAASEAGLSASSYDGLIDSEKRTKNSAGVDEMKWKRAKEHKAKA